MKIDKTKVYTVTQIADITGVSKASVSRWLNKQGVSPEYEKGKSKFFKATYVQQYLTAHKSHKNKKKIQPSVVDMLQEQVNQLIAENKRLISRIEKQDEQLKAKDQLIADKDKSIADFGQEFAQLADQAQQLDLAGKKIGLLNDSNTIDNKNQSETETVKTDQVAKKHHWWNIFTNH